MPGRASATRGCGQGCHPSDLTNGRLQIKTPDTSCLFRASSHKQSLLGTDFDPSLLAEQRSNVCRRYETLPMVCISIVNPNMHGMGKTGVTTHLKSKSDRKARIFDVRISLRYTYITYVAAIDKWSSVSPYDAQHTTLLGRQNQTAAALTAKALPNSL